VMYLIGGSMGTSVTGWLSDRFARQASLAEGATEISAHAKAIGLRDALFELPVLAFVLSLVLLTAARLLAAQIRAKETAGETQKDLV
jgi:hypothetical protein